MRFTKIQGTGNDFIVLNNMSRSFSSEELSQLARRLCQRRISIGADGLMAVEPPENPSEQTDFRMRFYNSDGSLAEMCGNGARCIARFAYESGLAGEQMRFETSAGPVEAWRLDRRRYRIRLNDPSILRMNVEWSEGNRADFVELGVPGVPHAVIPISDLSRRWDDDKEALLQLGSAARWSSSFPKGANVNFYEWIGEDHVLVRTFERGVEDFTLACGTGVSSVAVVLALRGMLKGETLQISVPGGTLFVEVVKGTSFKEYKEESLNTDEMSREILPRWIEALYLIGETNLVANGEVLDEGLKIERESGENRVSVK